jgi:DNA-binding transcriptional ArsR family regulator
MVYQSVDVGRVFHALSDATRRDIVQRLKTAPQSVSTLAEPYRMSLPALTKHLAVLEAAGLVRTSKTGRIRQCALATDALKAAAAWLSDYEEFWTDRLDALEAHLSETNGEDQP